MNKMTSDDFDVVEADDPLDTSKEYFNDAELLGVETAAFVDMLERPAVMMVGEMWGSRDRRNTPDEGWKPVTMPWAGWINGGKGDKNTAPWGFSRHPVHKEKAGACIVLGSSIGGARKAKAMETMYAMGIDIDAGYPLDTVLAKLEQLGVFCLVYTSHSHGKSVLQLKYDEVIRKLQIKPSELNLAQVQRFLREHDKNRYEETFIQHVQITHMKKQVTSGVVIELATPPLDKYRLIFPLAEPVKLIDLGGTQTEALEAWENKITGLAVEYLGVHFDTSCTDPSRLFYTARHPKDADDWYCGIVRGDPLDFDAVPSMKKSTYTNSRKPMNAFEMAAGALEGGDRARECVAPSGASLNEWHRKAKARFNMADLLEDMCPDKIRRAGGEAQGHVHIECPFEHEHSSEGGTGCDARNALDSSSGYWTWGCHHDACQGRHKLEFLEEALRQGWFSEELLFGDSVYLMEAEDDPEEEEDVLEPGPEDLLAMVEDFNRDTPDAAVRDVIKVAIAADADTSTWSRLKEAVAAQTAIGKRDFDRMRKSEVQARKDQKPKGRAKTGIETCAVKEDFPVQLNYTKRRIREANDERTRLFQFGGAFAMADTARHRVRLAESRDDMFSILSDLTRWEVLEKVGDDYVPRLVAPPETVVRAIYKDSDFADTLPELIAVPTTPFFGPDGSLVDEDGYHAGAKVYLAKGDLVLPGVSREPSAEEVAEAKRLLVEEVLADFPLGGMDRAQIVGTLSGENAESAHAVTHAVAFTLLPFCRDMIAGPTPGHVYTKPGPGTGASLLVDVLTTIAMGAPAPAMELPGKGDEISKTLSAALAAGAPVALFDNVGQSIASPALAMAMTGATYQARILGKSQLVSVPVRALWAFTANNIEATPEILRRFVLIPLDAGVPDPERRKPVAGWRHPNIRHWVTDNRPKLVWACLTLIKNWVAQGMERQSAVTLASFEDWAGVMGGILAAAGFQGFLEGQAEEREKATDAAEDGLLQLLSLMAEYPSGTVFRAGGTGTFEGRGTISAMDILNGTERHGVKVRAEEDPIQIDGWGYSAYDGAYKTSGRIGRGLKHLARKPHEVDGQVVSFEEIKDTRNKSAVYRMTK